MAGYKQHSTATDKQKIGRLPNDKTIIVDTKKKRTRSVLSSDYIFSVEY